MKNFLTIGGLSAVLLAFGLFVASQISEAQPRQKDVALALLELPAPPPFNPQVENNFKRRGDGFYSRSRTPADDAPTADLLDYWQKINGVNRGYKYVPVMTDRVAERLLAEIEKEPALAYELLNSLAGKPETASAVKKLYDKQIAESDGGEDSDEARPSAALKKWLTYNTDYFSDELLREARKSSETDEYVTGQEEVLALARVDWDKARLLLEKMLDNNAQPISQTLARWGFYKHAIAANDSSDAEKYREQLKATVENKNAKPGERDLAMDALVEEGDFAGRDDWYYSLLADESLYDLRVNGRNFTGLTTIVNHSAPEKYLAKMLELLKSENKNVRSAAVINLTTMLDGKNEQVVRALLPWLEHPDWARETGRQRKTLIDALSTFTMPESVPGLIAVLNEKTTRQTDDMSGAMSTNGMMSGGAMSNRAMTNQSSTVYAEPTEDFPYRSAAVSALTIQKDARAVPALRALLTQNQNYERTSVIAALLACGGFTVSEQVDALEAASEMTRKMNAAYAAEKTTIDTRLVNADVSAPNVISSIPSPSSLNRAMAKDYPALAGAPDSGDLKLELGSLLMNKTEVGDDLVAAVARRIDEPDAKNPQLAQSLRGVLEHWEGAAVNVVLLRDLKNGKASAGAVVKLLSVRRDLREKQSNDVFDLRGAAANPAATGVAACLLEDVSEYDRILAGAANTAEKIALLACARLIRARLPVSTVAGFLRAGDKSLALAAERYLESEDSAEARLAVLSTHPNEAKILGATTAFNVGGGTSSEDVARFLPALFAGIGDEPTAEMPYYMLFLNPNDVSAMEKRLQKEVKEDEHLVGIYAYDKNFVRIYADKAVFSWEEDDARYRERDLDAAEFNRLKSLLARYRADELPPFLTACESCRSDELLMLGRAGGRRVFYRRGARVPEFFAELDKTFAEMREPPARLRYWLEKSVPGLRVLFADDNLQARAVWKNADDLRVLIDDRAARKRIDREISKLERLDEEKDDYDYQKGEAMQQKRRNLREYENFSWRKLEPDAAGENHPGDLIAQPPNFDFIPARDAGAAAQPTDKQWKARTAAGAEIRAGETDGLFKVARGQSTKIRGGNYGAPVITPDGRWAIIEKYDEENGDKLVRVNLLNAKEFAIKLPDDLHYEATAFIAQINRFLLAGGNYDDYSDTGAAALANKKFFLLDADTGLVSSAKGEMRPLAQQTFRALQAASSGADEFWAAIPDAGKNETQIGVFNQKTFVFKQLLTVPRIEFDSMNLWADERENKIYFVYQGHLLALPLPKSAN